MLNALPVIRNAIKLVFVMAIAYLIGRQSDEYGQPLMFDYKGLFVAFIAVYSLGAGYFMKLVLSLHDLTFPEQDEDEIEPLENCYDAYDLKLAEHFRRDLGSK